MVTLFIIREGKELVTTVRILRREQVVDAAQGRVAIPRIGRRAHNPCEVPDLREGRLVVDGRFGRPIGVRRTLRHRHVDVLGPPA